MLYGKGVFVLSWGDGVWYGQEEAFINKKERGTHNGEEARNKVILKMKLKKIRDMK